MIFKGTKRRMVKSKYSKTPLGFVRESKYLKDEKVTCNNPPKTKMGGVVAANAFAAQGIVLPMIYRLRKVTAWPYNADMA